MRAWDTFISISRDELIDLLKDQLSAQRFEHVLSVESTVLNLAKQIGFEEYNQVSICALLHDLCKEMPEQEMYQLAIQYQPALADYHGNGAIWHGAAAAQYAKNHLGVKDQEILQAVSDHTIGSVEMSCLSQLLFVADYIEPGRTFEEAAEVREIANYSLKLATRQIMKQTLLHLVKLEKNVYPPSVVIYNHWMEERND